MMIQIVIASCLAGSPKTVHTRRWALVDMLDILPFLPHRHCCCCVAVTFYSKGLKCSLLTLTVGSLLYDVLAVVSS